MQHHLTWLDLLPGADIAHDFSGKYVVLNPVRAKIVDQPGNWPWCSFRATSGEHDAPPWLNTEWLLSQFGATPGLAIAAYRQFVLAGIGKESPLRDTSHQMVLGDRDFVAKHAARLAEADFTAVVMHQRRICAMTLLQYEKAYPERDEAIARAYHSTAFTMIEIARHFAVSNKTVGRAVRRFEILR